MSCHICNIAHSRPSLLCPTCARNRLYQLRLDYGQVLLDKEARGREIEAAVSLTSDNARASDATKLGSEEVGSESSQRWAFQIITNQRTASSHRREDIRQNIKALKEAIDAKKNDITQRKEILARRRSDATSAQYQLQERDSTLLTSIQNTTKRTEHLWHSLHSRTAESRIFLCREAAHLHGLRQRVTKNDSRPAYLLGGIPIVDLRDMNGAPPEQISTSLSNVARLVVLVSHYLSLRLPAEITLPHRNHPTATIYTPASSYSFRENKSSSSSYGSSSPTASRATDSRSQPRPRPLFIDKPLPRLAKEDTGAYGLFLEGATLLAWDVAWLCRTQGINLTSDSWEEACNIGKGLWQLLIAPPAQTSTLMRAFAGRDTQNKLKHARDSPQTTIQRTRSFPMLGHYSHGTVHSFLSASEGSEFTRTWKLPTPTKIADKLKANLLGEMASAEWELLEGPELDDEGVDVDVHSVTSLQATLAPIKPQSGPSHDSNVVGTGFLEETDARRAKGTSGWTKLNSR
ncbi:hypothetical protein N7470_009115 [Penicillium chermesinum]|nr:hypothetical protein N7470_009115 [Penicillium chermesinum]